MVDHMATKKVTVTIPVDLLDEIREEAAERGISAYVTEALRDRRSRDKLADFVGWLDEEYGAPTEEELGSALAGLEDLDAEHDRRRKNDSSGRSGDGAVAA